MKCASQGKMTLLYVGNVETSGVCALPNRLPLYQCLQGWIGRVSCNVVLQYIM